MSERKVIDWLLEENQPAIRYHTFTDLLERSPEDAEVREARAMIPKVGWAADILSEQLPGGFWVGSESLYRPKYIATNWRLLVLGDLGLTNEEPRVRKACQLVLDGFSKPDGGFGPQRINESHLCIAGNTARMMIQFGYLDHPQVRSAMEWLVREQKPDGGWHCWGRRGVLDAWEGMSAFAVYPRQRWTRSMKRGVERGADFFLERRLYRQGRRYSPWFRFHYPVHYYYDLLVGMDFMSALGYGDDRRLRYALKVLKEKRRSGGCWNLEAVHRDVEGKRVTNWYRRQPYVPLALEKVGKPSKMITFRALRVLKRVQGDLPRA